MPADVATQIVVISSTKISGHVSGQILMVAGGMEGKVLSNSGKACDLIMVGRVSREASQFPP